MENQNDMHVDLSSLGQHQAKTEDAVMVSKSKVVLAKKLVTNLRENLEQLNLLLGSMSGEVDDSFTKLSVSVDESLKSVFNHVDLSEKIIEGMFDGEAMIGPDGKRYNVSANYASKSKLVEGDILKLSITSSGTFVYKQIGPIERVRVMGTIKRINENDFIIIKDNRTWKVLNASVTYFKGDDGDEAVILVPKNAESKWAAVENVIKVGQ
ncbi:MAG: hypothetical protein WCG01_01880 [bacterium]